MGTDEVIRKTLALAQSQLSNYKTMDAHKANSGATQATGSHNDCRPSSQSSAAAIQQPPKQR